MADPKFPYVKWRGGRPRAVHGPRQRLRGFVDQDLKRPDGSWYTMEEAAAFSDTRVREVAESRTTTRALPPRERRRTTLDHLLQDWMASPEFKALRPASQKSYRKGVNAVILAPETRAAAAERRARERACRMLGLPPQERAREIIADAPPSAIGKPELRDLFNYACRVRGRHMAVAMIASVSAAFTWGCESAHWRLKANPRIDMTFERPRGRVVLVTMPEFMAWVAAADAIGKPSIGDCLYLGLFTGQRQTDRLAMTWLNAANDRFTFRQSKTDELVDIKSAAMLTARLGQARGRVAELTLKFRRREAELKLPLRELPTQIVINETDGRPFSESTYRHWVGEARRVAVEGIIDEAATAAAAAAGRNEPVWLVPPCPSLAGKHDQDMRDTAVIMMDRAGCDLLTICDVTGHSYKSAQTILKHYRARNAARADMGIAAIEMQVRKEGMTG